MQVEDLEVYQKLFKLTLEIHELTMTFPKFEVYELGSQYDVLLMLHQLI